MRIAIIGAGALGSTIAAGLASGGHEVVLVDAVAEVVDRIRCEGVVLAVGEERRRVKLPAVTSLRRSHPFDLVLFLVKTYDTEQAVPRARGGIGENTILATLQNGLGAAEVLARHFDPGRVVYGVTYLGATREGGVVRPHSAGPTYVGPWEAGGTVAADLVAQGFRDAGWRASAESDVGPRVWEKLAVNCMTNAVSALASLDAAQMLELEGVARLQAEIAAEVVAVGRASGQSLTLESCQAALRATLSGAGSASPSMRGDFDIGRRTEIEALNGAIERSAAALGQEAPVNRTIAALVRAWEGSQLESPGPGA